MKLASKLSVIVTLALGLAVAAVADETVTLQGKVVCAKCVLKKKGLTECQNVLLVPEGVTKEISQKDGLEAKETAYYIVNNEVGKTFGEVCMEAKKTTVTGTVSEKDELIWITPSKMEPVG
jgi:SpoU rRNA methylase family enzyme